MKTTTFRTDKGFLVRFVADAVAADADIRFGEAADLLKAALESRTALYRKRLDRDAALEERAADIVLAWLADKGVPEAAFIGHQGSLLQLVAEKGTAAEAAVPADDRLAELDGFASGQGCERLSDLIWQKVGGLNGYEVPENRAAASRSALAHIRRCGWCSPEWADRDKPGGDNPADYGSGYTDGYAGREADKDGSVRYREGYKQGQAGREAAIADGRYGMASRALGKDDNGTDDNPDDDGTDGGGTSASVPVSAEQDDRPETFGFTLTDERIFDNDNPASARFFGDEPDDRVIVDGYGFPSLECAAAAAGRFLSAAWKQGRRFRNDEVSGEVADDRKGGGYGNEDAADLRNTGRKHSPETCEAGCGFSGMIDRPFPGVAPSADEGTTDYRLAFRAENRDGYYRMKAEVVDEAAAYLAEQDDDGDGTDATASVPPPIPTGDDGKPTTAFREVLDEAEYDAAEKGYPVPDDDVDDWDVLNEWLHGFVVSGKAASHIVRFYTGMTETIPTDLPDDAVIVRTATGFIITNAEQDGTADVVPPFPSDLVAVMRDVADRAEAAAVAEADLPEVPEWAAETAADRAEAEAQQEAFRAGREDDKAGRMLSAFYCGSVRKGGLAEDAIEAAYRDGYNGTEATASVPVSAEQAGTDDVCEPDEHGIGRPDKDGGYGLCGDFPATCSHWDADGDGTGCPHCRNEACSSCDDERLAVPDGFTEQDEAAALRRLAERNGFTRQELRDDGTGRLRWHSVIITEQEAEAEAAASAEADNFINIGAE